MIQDQPLVVFSLRRNSFRRRSSITNLDDRGWTPLHVKARKGDLKSVKQLLDQGFDVNALAWGPKSKGVSPLHLAAEGGHIEVMDLLLERGANIDARTWGSCGWTPLHAAAKERKREAVKFLVENGAFLPDDISDTRFNPPVHYCHGLEWAYEEMKKLNSESSSSGLAVEKMSELSVMIRFFSLSMASSRCELLVICVLSLFFVLAHSKTLKRDVKALNEIKASLGWRVVYSWVGDDPCGDGDLPPWSGVTCSTQGDYRVVTELDLHNNKLTGPIPPQIGRLKRLKVLNLRWNKLQDVIPPEIGELKRLTHLYLSFNSFKGEIPKELAALPELRYLYLQENRLIGRIPAELGTLQNLRHLDVGNNHLVGTIRELIRFDGSFPSLRNLYLNNNYLSGGIPAQLSKLTSLEIVYLSYNKFIGNIPFAISHIPKLTFLYLDHNQFTGRIPDAFYKHPFLKEMYIEGNMFKQGANPIGTHIVLEVSDSDFVV
ncbi:hypothetical protein HID58_032110 [Brassica napus]|uniref:Leucine-rich repeat-containing N-terminal plant-type domain-containing protein n=1 Tax=Brassica napus TaxID=3708 RepID=A0ABQ8BVK7_BRANA|nr:hypothetical protein HID58_032110 [Brassica napus]